MAKEQTYNRWGLDGSKHNSYLKSNYKQKSNTDIAGALGRTEDAVRKQLNKLGLKRPLKSETENQRPTLPKKRGRKKFRSFFTIVSLRRRNRMLNEKMAEKKANEQSEKKNERTWANNFLNSNDRRSNTGAFIPDMSGQMPVRIDQRTTVYVKAGSDPEEVRRKFMEKTTRNFKI